MGAHLRIPAMKLMKQEYMLHRFPPEVSLCNTQVPHAWSAFCRGSALPKHPCVPQCLQLVAASPERWCSPPCCRVGEEETWASPTRLALVLAGGSGGGGRGSSAAADAAAGTIIVETNYRVGQRPSAPSALPCAAVRALPNLLRAAQAPLSSVT